MLRTISRSRFWQFGSVAFVAGLGAGLLAGRSLFVVALLLVVTILTALAIVLVAALRAASLSGGEANQPLYEHLHIFSFTALTAIAAFAGYCLGVLFVGGL
jgi:hypothetical protein